PPGQERASGGESVVAEGSHERMLIRVPWTDGAALAAALHAAQAVRSARKAPGSVRVTLDALDIG
ncbi:MAG TPA: primosome assembly protein PriA, partial [Mycobacteriales bacterium]|nr:primosome assembly protein PriA [Mycobacteriales bacterium]